MKKRFLFLILVVSFIFISGCTSTVPTEQPSLPIAETEEPTTPIQEVNTISIEAPAEDNQTAEKPAAQKEIIKEIVPPTPIQTPPSASPVAEPSPAPTLIGGKTSEERLAEAYERLHTRGSAEHIRKSFPDIELVYTDDAVGMPFPREIIPFRYYYSREADTTFNICAIDFTVFICKGKLDKLIRKGDIDSGRCKMTPIYGDPRL